MAARKKVKYFVLDTNVLIHDPDAFREFGDNTVVICEEVLEELDSLKKRSDDTDGSVAASARKASNGLAEFLNGGDVRAGIKLPNGGKLVVSLDSKYPLKFKRDTPDNRILSFAHGLSEEGKAVFVISKDTNVRLKSSGLGLGFADYTKDQSELFKKYGSVFEGGDEKPNGILSIRYQIRGSEIWRFCGGDNGRMIHKKRSVMGIFPRNGEQECALDALSCPDIEAVALSGIAGTGKTLLALLVGISQTAKKNPLYERVIVARPPVTVGNKNSDIGFFPGDKEEKLMNWMEPIKDNLKVILKNIEPPEEGKFRKKFAEKDNYVVLTLEKLLSSGKLELESIGHIRGRSLSKTFIIIDEAQNTRPLDVKTLITRCGEGSKIVFCGDLGQIDAPYLDSSSSGLAHLIDRFKDDENFCHLRLEQGVRSKLAEKAARLL